MDKNAIKKFAVWARRELISRVSQKALQYGIDEDNIVPGDATSVNGTVLSNEEMKQRKALIERINDKGYQQIMEEVAYTWFNRFSALRFMEVNGYLPSRVRVFTDEENNFKPQILAEAIHLELDGLDMEKVYEFKDNNNDDGLFKYLIITQCNALGAVMPRMFEKISDYTELLFPDNLLREGSVVQQMIEMIPEEDWKDAVQIIGWLYQFYNIEPKADVFAKSGKISKEEIPAATQLFTPDWIVRYMVENSLGRLWVEGHPDAKEQLLPTQEEQSAYITGNRDEEDTKWHYYLEEAEQEVDVLAQLAEIRKEYATITPEQIKCIDPCSGSGHILAYMFDVLMQIYENYGYTAREAVRSIIENNIYGLDIDDRAAQLAYFAVMMKARKYDRRFLTRKDEAGNPDVPQPNVFAIIESNGIDTYTLDYFVNGDSELKAAMNVIIAEMDDAKEYGSLLTIQQQKWSNLYDRFEEINQDIHISRETTLRELLPLVQVAEVLAQKYNVVITNPPYMSIGSADVKLNNFVKKNFPDSKSDMYSIFIEKCQDMLLSNGIQAMITMHSWMFLSSFEKLRGRIMCSNLVNMVHLGARAFEEIGGEVVQTTSFIVRNKYLKGYKGVYCRLIDPTSQDAKKTMFLAEENRFDSVQDDFSKIPASPLAYWLSGNVIKAFDEYLPLSEYADSRSGMSTTDNQRFLREWFEPAFQKIGFGYECIEDTEDGMYKWFPYNKGGSYRKWYGNRELVVNWHKNGEEMKYWVTHNPRDPKTKTWSRRIFNTDCSFKAGITWSALANEISMRLCENGFMFDSKGASCFVEKDKLYLLGYLNSVVAREFLKILCPTLDFNPGQVAKIPIKIDETYKSKVVKIVDENVIISKLDWDSFENSWDFKKHPLIKGNSVEEAFIAWEKECEERFEKLKSNEEELNNIFIDIYGLQNELSSEIDDKDVSVRKADLQRDIKSLISYAVGCMFGRYSLDIDGLAFAGDEWNLEKYKTFKADVDNIIPICDDEYFEDDITGYFIKFIEAAYGKDNLETNLQYIAKSLGDDGQPRDVIRKYFFSDFYVDHCAMYSGNMGKRPIYWLFDSGKKGGFRALVYMHRYQPDTIARMRTDYVHEQQSRYRTAIADLEQRIESASTSERVKLNRRLKTLNEQAVEIQGYEEKIHHLADQYISIDLDDGVKKNYEIFKDVLAKIK